MMSGPRFATSYFGNRILRHVRSDMTRLRQDGFDILVHTCSENDLRFYRGTLRDIVSATRDAGLEVWLDPWGVGGVFGGEAFSAAALEQPEWRQRSRDGTPLPACCPSHPGFRAFLADWIGAACESGAEAIFWDEPHLFTDRDGVVLGCHCAHCRALAEDTGISEPRLLGAEVLLRFLGWLCHSVGQEGRRNVVCVLPHDAPDTDRLDWSAVTRLPGVDNLGTVPFWVLRGEEPAACLTRFGRELIRATSAAGVQSHLWIQGFRIPAGRESEITTAVLAAAGLAPDVIAIWGFDACGSMSSLACERPEVAWRAFLRARSIAGR
jgi:hypothetical protein